ncbi:MAG: C39 family peptidase [Elusimicrobiota bacterium]
MKSLRLAAAPLPLLLAVSIAASPLPSIPADHLKVPVIPQAHSYSCGAAVMMAVLLYWKLIDQNESSLYAQLKTTPEEGTDPLHMRDLARAYKLTADIRTEQTLADLTAGLARGETVVLDLQAWPNIEPGKDGEIDYAWEQRWEDGHYVILVGADAHYLYAMDPSSFGRYAYLPKSELMARWRDYENRDGKRVEHQQLAIYIKGEQHLEAVPAPLIRMR